jgi:hypothetical protein
VISDRDAELDLAYSDGQEDLARQVIELIHQSDFEISLEDIIEFLETTLGDTETYA